MLNLQAKCEKTILIFQIINRISRDETVFDIFIYMTFRSISSLIVKPLIPGYVCSTGLDFDLTFISFSH